MKMLSKIKGVVIVVLMAVLSALSYQIFIFQNAFAPSGINGIATMIQHKVGLSVAVITLIVNTPLCILAFIYLNKGFAAKTAIFLLVFSGVLLVFRYGLVDLTPFIYKTDNGTSTILGPVAAGVLNGFVYGAVLRQNASTGGVDIIAALIHKKHPEQSTIWIIFALNTAVAVASYFVYDFSMEPVVLCIIYSFLTSRIGDNIVRGNREQVKFEIITRDYDAISHEIIERLGHTATVVPARGMYSGNETELLLCVCHKYQIAEMQDIIKKYPGTFATLSSVSDTIGNFRHVRHKLL